VECKIDFVFRTHPQRRLPWMHAREILDIFTRHRCFAAGAFVLRSGLHSGHYFQCAQCASGWTRSSGSPSAVGKN